MQRSAAADGKIAPEGGGMSVRSRTVLGIADCRRLLWCRERLSPFAPALARDDEALHSAARLPSGRPGKTPLERGKDNSPGGILKTSVFEDVCILSKGSAVR